MLWFFKNPPRILGTRWNFLKKGSILEASTWISAKKYGWGHFKFVPLPHLTFCQNCTSNRIQSIRKGSSLKHSSFHPKCLQQVAKSKIENWCKSRKKFLFRYFWMTYWYPEIKSTNIVVMCCLVCLTTMSNRCYMIRHYMIRCYTMSIRMTLIYHIMGLPLQQLDSMCFLCMATTNAWWSSQLLCSTLSLTDDGYCHVLVEN